MNSTKFLKKIPFEKEIGAEIVHLLPNDFELVIKSDENIKNLWGSFTPLGRNEWICWVTSSKKSETRVKRIQVALDKMRKGMKRPCCWPGCPHR